MRCRLSRFPPEAARDLDQHDEHGDASNEEIAQDSGAAIHVANEDRADAHVAIHGGISDEGELPARETPGERCATGGKETEKPYEIALPIEDPGEQCPKENVGRNIQIRAEEMRFQSAALKCGSSATDRQAVENRILPVRFVLMGWPVRDGEPEPSAERG